ncbi:MAG: ABC transporter ATP-binding protein, partial [Planctomycetes bacterium]|nr:ABC transporter ATP-binding protein [Planctomycetota bacterium]
MAKSAPASVHEDAVTGRIFEWRLYRRFLPFARPYLKWFAASVVLLLLLAVTTIAGPFVIKYATAVVISDEPVDYHWRVRKVMTYFLGAGRVDVAGAALTFWTAVFISIGLVTFGLRYLQLWVTAWTGQRVVFDLRNHVFRHVQRRSLRFFDTNPVGRLVTRVTSDIENLAELFSSGIDVVFYDLVMIAITLSLLFWVSPTMALIVLALVPFVAIWSFKFKREAQELFRNVRSRVTRLNSFINESVTGIRVIQIFRAEKRVNERFADWDADLRESHRKTVRNFSMFYPGVEMFSSLGTALIAVSGQALFAEGSIRAE